MVSDDNRLASAFFAEYVFGFMKHDLEAAIEGKANFLAALGLVTYSEFLGALKLGTVTTDADNRSKFEAFLPYLGPAYELIDKQIKADPRSPRGLYQVVRSGLVHEYFVKEDALIARHGNVPSGVFRDTLTGKLVLVAKKFLEDFLVAAEKVRDEIAKAPNPETTAFMRRFIALQPANLPSTTPHSSSHMTAGTVVGPTTPDKP